MNKLLRSVLRAGLYFLDQSDRATADVRDHMKGQVENIASRTRQAVGIEEDHFVRDAISFAAGVGVGIGVGMLFAPASGWETRRSIGEKVHEVGTRMRGRFSQEVERAS